MIKSLWERKFSVIYFLSFFIYPMIICSNWIYYLGDYLCAILAVLLAVYELMFIIFIRKKENISLGRSISKGFLFALISLNTIPVYFLADDFINGYQEYAFLGGPIGERYYGFNAIVKDEVTLFILGITFPALVIYLIAYIIISLILKKKK